MELREYQLYGIGALRTLMAQGLKRLVLYAPTGSGKTEIALATIRRALERGKKVAFVANRKTLVHQASRRFWKAGIKHGIIQADNTINVNSDVLVCSIDTLYARDMSIDVDLFIIDEAHGVPGSKKYRELLFKRNAVPVIGLTATPFSRGMGKHYDELGGPLFQDMVVAATIPELIDLGYLVDCDIYGPPKKISLKGVKTKRDKDGLIDYVETDLAEVMDQTDLIGDIVRNWNEHAKGKPTVVFASSIAHSKHIVEQFQANGVTACHLDCYMDDDDREQALRDFNEGRYTVLSCVSLLAEGWDDPHCECMVIARPTKSLIRWIQMAGRILRPFDGKTIGIILDHANVSETLGYPTDELPLELDDGRPKQTNPQPPKEKTPTQCPACHFMKPPGTHQCPRCHFAPEKQADVHVIDATLEKKERNKAKKEMTLEQRLQFYAELRTIARDRGYKDGWASNQYRERFGVWPNQKVGMAEPSPETEAWVQSRLIRYAKGKQKQKEVVNG